MKSAMKISRTISLALAIMFSIAACGEIGDPTIPTDTVMLPDSATPRYETVPYSSNSTHNAGNNDKPVYSAHDNTNNYYFFVLGHVNSVPIAYRTAMRYNGQTPVTIGYSRSDVNETSISRSVEEAYTHSITNSSTSQWSLSAEVGFKESWFSAKVSETVGGSTGWDETNTRSVTNTFVTASSWASQEGDSYQTTIGNNGEPPGKYRFSLFTTTDVYYVLITNRARTQVIEAYTAVCARPQSIGWGLDYEPDINGSFAKTAGGDLLKIPAIVLSQLPDPDIYVDISLLLPTVTFNANGAAGGTSPASQTVNNGGSINIPNNGTLSYSGRVFSGWNTRANGSGTNYAPGEKIVVNENITLYANWVIITKEYTIGNMYDSGGLGTDFTDYKRIDDISVTYRADFDLAKLKEMGYTKIRFTYVYSMTIFGTVQYRFRLYNPMTNTSFDESSIHNPDKSFDNRTITFTADLSRLENNHPLEIQASYRKIYLLWVGDFKIKPNRKLTVTVS